jgi:hypothetical protein
MIFVLVFTILNVSIIVGAICFIALVNRIHNNLRTPKLPPLGPPPQFPFRHTSPPPSSTPPTLDP